MYVLRSITQTIRTLLRALGMEHTPRISQGDLLHSMEANTAPLILDVRTPEEFSNEHLPSAVNIPHTDLLDRLSEIRSSQHTSIVVH